jgi:hypothetical protein
VYGHRESKSKESKRKGSQAAYCSVVSLAPLKALKDVKALCKLIITALCSDSFLNKNFSELPNY